MRSTFIDYSRRVDLLSTKIVSSLSPNYWGVQTPKRRTVSTIATKRLPTFSLGNADDIRAQIGSQDFRDNYAAIGLLEVLNDRDHHAWCGEAASV